MKRRKKTKRQKAQDAAMKRTDHMVGEIVVLTALLTAPLWLDPGVWAAIKESQKRPPSAPKLEISDGRVIEAESVVVS